MRMRQAPILQSARIRNYPVSTGVAIVVDQRRAAVPKYGPGGVILSNDDAVLAECEELLRRTLDLIDRHRLNRIVAARLAHLINDVAAQRSRGGETIGEDTSRD